MQHLIICCLVALTSSIYGQAAFNDCAAICLDKVALVNDYSPRGQCATSLDANGNLSVYTVNLSENSIEPKQAIAFKVAIRDAATKTIWSFSEKSFTQIDIEKVLANCKKGDHIIVMTVDRAFALPHNEILVQ